MKNFVTIQGHSIEVKSVNPTVIMDNYGDNPFWNNWEVIIVSVNEIGYLGTMDGDDLNNNWAYDTFELTNKFDIGS